MRFLSITLATAASVVAFAAPSFASTATVQETAHLTAAGTTYYTAYSAKDMIDCKAGRLCLYTAPNFRGMQVSWPAGNYTPDFTKIKCASGYCQTNGDFNDEASSWANNSTGMRYCVSRDIGGGGWDNSMPNLTQGNFGAGYDGQASSLSFQGCP
ncbi:MAG: peptidase inhibitor family I36 protein [Nonomuraea sp.]|nr:peptidase inhibitor family I36 protein [Nonomuraea sp.]